MADRPLLALTLGDPCGIGPEIIVRAATRPAVHEAARLVAVGRAEILRRAGRLVDSPLEVV